MDIIYIKEMAAKIRSQVDHNEDYAHAVALCIMQYARPCDYQGLNMAKMRMETDNRTISYGDSDVVKLSNREAELFIILYDGNPWDYNSKYLSTLIFETPLDFRSICAIKISLNKKLATIGLRVTLNKANYYAIEQFKN